MDRILLVFLYAPVVFLSGCVGTNLFRARRDVNLTRWEAPSSQAFEPASFDSVALDTYPPQPPLFVDRSANTNSVLGLDNALKSALQNSQVVRVLDGSQVVTSRNTFYDIAAADQRVTTALAAFDTSFEARFYSTRIKQPPDAFFGPGLSQPSLRDEGALNLGLVKPLVTGGKARLFYNPDPGYLFIPNPSNGDFNPRHVGNLELTIEQPLLRGAGVALNRVPIQITQISASQSAWEFKKAAMASVRGVIEAYWELHAAHVALRSIDEVLPLLEEIVRIQEEAYKAEWVIYADVAKAIAQLHTYRQQRLDLESEVVAREYRLRHLMGLPPVDGYNIEPSTMPTEVRLAIDSNLALGQALANNPDLVRERLEIRLRELELLVARNLLKPNLDFRALYRMNGVGEDLGSAISQMSTAEFADWELGATFSVPLGRRQGKAETHAAELRAVRENHLLQQMVLSTTHDLGDNLRRIDFAYREYQEASQRARAAGDWVKGARLRFQNPNPDAGDGNWLLQNLNDYLAALRFRTDAATNAAEVLARYNTELARLEETKGTILDFYGIAFATDPCLQSRYLDTPANRLPPPVAPQLSPSYEMMQVGRGATVPATELPPGAGRPEVVPAPPTPSLPRLPPVRS